MTVPPEGDPGTAFPFAAWLAATGWSDAEAARRLGLVRETVNRMARGAVPVSAKTAEKCRGLARDQIAALAKFAELSSAGE